MTIQKGICAECGKEYEYEYNPQFPRKYCHECSAAKKASFEGVQPVNAPVVKVPQAMDAHGNNIPNAPVVKPNNHTTMYVSYAKDIFVALSASKEFIENYDKINNGVTPTKDIMHEAIELVKQAKEAFE